MSTALDPKDGHAIDLKYHRKCWVANVQRPTRKETEGTSHPSPKQITALIELLHMVDFQTSQKAILSIEELEKTYLMLIGDEQESHVPTYNRKWLKSTVLQQLPHLKAVRQTQVNQPSLLYSPDACDPELTQVMAAQQVDTNEIVEDIYKCATVIRKDIKTYTKENPHTLSLDVTSKIDDLPPLLQTLLRWIICGPMMTKDNSQCSTEAECITATICQDIMFATKTDRQVSYSLKNETASFRNCKDKENQKAIGLALTVHNDTRNKTIIDLLSSHGYCISYGRTMMIETAIANAVLRNMDATNGVFLPPFLKKDQFVFFAADNVDFSEDTFDGKGTLHATITAVYQRQQCDGDMLVPPLTLQDSADLTLTPNSVPVMECAAPNNADCQKTVGMSEFSPSNEESKLGNLEWMVARCTSQKSPSESNIPGWAGFNSLVNISAPKTNIGTLPLLAVPAHEWGTLLTVLKTTQNINTAVLGEDNKTVLTLDMALYEKALRLIDSRAELKNRFVLRLGELHVAMAVIRAIGSSIEGSGLDDLWVESGVYGPNTVRQILNCTHYRRAVLHTPLPTWHFLISCFKSF